MQPTTKGERLLITFRKVQVLPEHLIGDNEGVSLGDYGIAAPMAKKLLAWGARKGLVREAAPATARKPAQWHWRQSFLQAAFALHADYFGDSDLMPKARALALQSSPVQGFVVAREGDHAALLQGSTPTRQRWGSDPLSVSVYATAEEADAAVQLLTDFDDNARVVERKTWLQRIA